MKLDKKTIIKSRGMPNISIAIKSLTKKIKKAKISYIPNHKVYKLVFYINHLFYLLAIYKLPYLFIR